jgi:hypothetical protein
VSSDPLSTDWPSRPGSRPVGGGFASCAFEDLFAPDAFGVQLLGAGYADRLPVEGPWRVSKAGSESILLEHRNAETWFANPAVPEGVTAHEHAIPQVLSDARAQLAPLLYSPGCLSRYGFDGLA